MPVGVALVMVASGLALLGHTWWCWSGRSRAWAARTFSRQWVLGWEPGLGTLLLGFGIVGLFAGTGAAVPGALLVVVGFALLALGLLAIFLEPRWWGPRWAHGRGSVDRRPDRGDALTAATVAAGAKPRFSSETRGARQAKAFGDRVDSWRGSQVYDADTAERAHALAGRGAVGGHLTLYRRGLVFAGNRSEDALRGQPTVIALPAADIVRARVVPARAGADGVRRSGVRGRSLFPRLVIETRGPTYLFEVMSAKGVARRISEVLERSPS
jgi:hypothetical protein